MSDRTAATVFSTVFETLAGDEFLMTDPDPPKKLAKKMWGLMSDFDFSPYQMYCDEALLKLGLARRVRDEYDPGGFQIEYGPPRR